MDVGCEVASVGWKMDGRGAMSKGLALAAAGLRI